MIFELKTLQEQMQNITNEVLSEDSELDIMEYDRCWGLSRIRLTAADLNKNQEILTRLLEETYELIK